MKNRAESVLPRLEKGPLAPPPVLDGAAGVVAVAVAAWPGVETTVHWHLCDRTRVDGVDFYLGEEELGHVHLDGEIHLATDRILGAELVAEGAAEPFRYVRGWVQARTARIGPAAAIALIRRNYDHLSQASGEAA